MENCCMEFNENKNYVKMRKIIDELFETNIAIFKGRSKP